MTTPAAQADARASGSMLVLRTLATGSPSRRWPRSGSRASARPEHLKHEAQVEVAGGVEFISDAALEEALDEAGVRSRAADYAVAAYQEARSSGLKAALAILAALALVALFLTPRIPGTQPGAAKET